MSCLLPFTASGNLLFCHLIPNISCFAHTVGFWKNEHSQASFNSTEWEPYCLPVGLNNQIFQFKIRRERHVTRCILWMVLVMSEMTFAVKKKKTILVSCSFIRVSSSKVMVGKSYASGKRISSSNFSFHWRELSLESPKKKYLSA